MKRFIKTLAAIVATTIVFAACSSIMDDLKVRPASQPEPTPTPTPAPVPEQTPTPAPAPTPAPEPSALATPLTLEAAADGAIVTFINYSHIGPGTVTYKVNGGEAKTIENGATENITLAAIGDKVEFWGDNSAYGRGGGSYENSCISCSEDCYIYGNIMSLISSNNFETETELKYPAVFYRFFKSNTHIKNKEGYDLLLPATKLTHGCYTALFSGCKKLSKAPALPATVLAEHCYDSMFAHCENIQTAPALPATTLAAYCYTAMFSGCTGLTTSPSLPAATLTEGCYSYMFENCSKLNSVTCLATNISANKCTENWLSGVAASGTFTKADGMTSWTTDSASGIPSGWTYNEDAPLAIPLTLEAAVAGAVVTFDNKAAGPVTYKVNGGEAQTIASGATGTITLEKVGDKVEFWGDNKAYATNYSNYSNIACSADCYVYGNIMSIITSEHFENSTALDEGYAFACFFRDNTHIKNKSGADLLLPATTLANSCYSGMFSGCTSLTAAPSLPATTLAN
ncbi:MAG: hypothetical protein IJL24_06325, partial [Treponema sp.]|nr:hypothetical protein [Treponema sp.]